MRRSRTFTNSGRGLAVALALGLLGQAREAAALDLNKRFTVGFRLGDYLPADEQKGGFRFSPAGPAGGAGEHAIEIGEVPVPTISLGWGVGKLGKRTQFSLELEVSRFESEVGDETAYHDKDASSRFALPDPTRNYERRLRQNGDEEFLRFPLGDVTLTPVLVNGLFHWTRDGGRADFYCGMGLGVVMADFTTSEEYRQFAKDFDGVPDISAEDAFAAAVRIGSNVSLSRNSGWMLYFDAEFLSTQLFSSDSQISWPGVDFTAGTQDIDTDGDNVDDEFGSPSDYRLIDPGHIRVDGLIAGIGVKYRFGGKKMAASSEAAADEPAP